MHRCATTLTLLLLASPAGLAAASDAEADYHQLLEWRYSATPTPLPPGGLSFQRDTATWTLETGSLRYAEPTSAGAVTGLVFEGAGRFRIEVPDPVEREQLGRFTKGRFSTALEVPFSKLILRASGGAAPLVGVEAGEGPHARSDLAAGRHDDLLEHQLWDVDARVVAGLLIPGDDYLFAAMDTADFGWLDFEYEPARPEEITVEHFERGFPEVWLSLDRAEDRLPTGRPGPDRRDPVAISHVDVRADLTRPGKGARAGITKTHPRRGEFSVDLVVEPEIAGSRALRLLLNHYAEVTAVRVDGAERPFLRHHVGGRGLTIDSDLYDDGLVVVLAEPLAVGKALTVSVDYELEILNYASGRFWYPDTAYPPVDSTHTGTFDLTVPERIEIRAMGRRVGEPEIEGRTRRERWAVEKPTFTLSFTFAERPFQYDLQVDGVPPVEVFGAGLGSEAKFHNVAADVAGATAFFQQVFRMPLDTDRLVVSSIVGGHGQAFEGFLHMGEASFYRERPGATELFRAHETAHEWWGYRVRWATYRDQWLSEAFAEYSAMMYLQAKVEDGQKWFEEVLFAYREALQGSIAAGFSKFQRAGIVPLNPNLRQEVGPIAVGYRAATADAPGGYLAQAYLRGPWVVHMLRVMLRSSSGSDDLFLQVLADFLAAHDGGVATTEDFIASLTRTAPGDWQWFFDQWVYGTAIPTYAWSWKAERGDDGQHALALTVRQEGVPEGFRMPVPVKVDLGDGQEEQVVILVDEPEETFHLPLPARPTKVELNPGFAVLAHTKGL